MKKHIAVLILIMATTFGCKEGLEPQLYGSLNPTNFPKSESDFDLLTTDVYKLFSSKWSFSDGGISGNLFYGVEYSNIFLNDAPSDLISYFPEWGGWSAAFTSADFNFQRTLASGRNHLEKIRFITKCTKLLDEVNKSSISEAAKKQYSAEIRTARGILMYNLLTMYGPVPFIIDPAKIGTDEEKNMTRPDRATYVAAVAADLRYAADNLAVNPATYGRFNKGCALTFLARLYLNEKDWSKSEQALKEIGTLGYTLVSNYASLFKAVTEKNTETIWAVTCDPAADGSDKLGNMNAWSYYCFPSNFPGNITKAGGSRVGGWAVPGALVATWQFYDSFNSSDARKTLLVDSYAAVNSSGVPTGVTVNRANGLRGPIIVKYPDDDPTAYSGNDIPVCRYSDVLLMLAEAINEQVGPTTEAQEYINLVRKRAGISELSGLEIASKEAFREAILRERGWELYFEGQRRVDLLRHNKWTSALSSVGKKPNPGTALFPVPQYMLDLGLKQTDGY